MDLLKAIRALRNTIQLSKAFKIGLICLTIISLALTAVASLVSAFIPSVLIVYNILIIILVVIQITFVLYSGIKYLKVVKQAASGASKEYDYYLKRTTICLFVEAASLVSIIILLVFFTLYRYNPAVYLIIHTLLKIAEFTVVGSVLLILYRSKPSSGVSKERGSSTRSKSGLDRTASTSSIIPAEQPKNAQTDLNKT